VPPDNPRSRFVIVIAACNHQDDMVTGQQWCDDFTGHAALPVKREMPIK